MKDSKGGDPPPPKKNRCQLNTLPNFSHKIPQTLTSTPGFRISCWRGANQIPSAISSQNYVIKLRYYCYCKGIREKNEDRKYASLKCTQRGYFRDTCEQLYLQVSFFKDTHRRGARLTHDWSTYLFPSSCSSPLSLHHLSFASFCQNKIDKN